MSILGELKEHQVNGVTYTLKRQNLSTLSKAKELWAEIEETAKGKGDDYFWVYDAEKAPGLCKKIAELCIEFKEPVEEEFWSNPELDTVEFQNVLTVFPYIRRT